MNYDRKNPEHVYQWCLIAQEFSVKATKATITSGEPLAEVWNKEKQAWEVAEHITPEYLLAGCEEKSRIIDKAFQEKDLIGLRYIQKDFAEQFGLEMEYDELSKFNDTIEAKLGADALKVRARDK